MEDLMTDKKSTGAETVRWDLSFLYAGPDDPALAKDVEKWVGLAKAFHAEHRGHLAETLGKAVTDYRALASLGNKVQVYLFLRLSVNTADDAVKKAMAKVEKAMNLASGEYLNFFDHELVALSDEVIASLAAKDAAVAKHLPWISLARVFKPHLLKEEVEGALTKRAQFGDGAWAEFFDEVEADLRFPFRGESKTLTEMVSLMNNDPDGETRAEAMKIVNAGLGGAFAKYSAQTLHMVTASKEVEDRERGYKHPMESRNKSSKIPDAVVESLHAAVREVAAPLAQRYYRLKAAHLGKKTLRWSDRNAPMPFADTTVVPWDKAVETVVAAYKSFSPTLARLVEETIAARRIDAPAQPGKQGGAYNYSICLPDGKPVSFTFLNFLGTSDDVMTLAHELGHGVHGLLAGESQGELQMHAPMAYAETASVFGEMTTFNFLKADLAKKGDKKALLALIMDKLDGITNTVVRQISFSDFERALHGHDAASSSRVETERRSPEDLDKLWMEVTTRYYGAPGTVFAYEDIEHLWSYISHFHRPFYVYAYAFGELLTQSLYAARGRLGERFEPLYLDLLRAGSTKDCVELLAPFGLDPTDPKFWTAGIEVSMGALVAEAEALSKEMGVTP
jgi:oligoendopeptidase F